MPSAAESVDQHPCGAASGQCQVLGVPAARLQRERAAAAGQRQTVASEAHERARGRGLRELEAHGDVSGRAEAMRLGIGCGRQGEDCDGGQEGGRLQRANGEHPPHIDGRRARVERRWGTLSTTAKCLARRAVAVPLRRRLPPGTRPHEWQRTFVDAAAVRCRRAFCRRRRHPLSRIGSLARRSRLSPPPTAPARGRHADDRRQHAHGALPAPPRDAAADPHRRRPERQSSYHARNRGAAAGSAAVAALPGCRRGSRARSHGPVSGRRARRADRSPRRCGARRRGAVWARVARRPLRPSASPDRSGEHACR